MEVKRGSRGIALFPLSFMLNDSREVLFSEDESRAILRYLELRKENKCPIVIADRGEYYVVSETKTNWEPRQMDRISKQTFINMMLGKPVGREESVECLKKIAG